jgi:hypothetical protein
MIESSSDRRATGSDECAEPREQGLPLSEEEIGKVFSSLGLETPNDRRAFCELGTVGQVQLLTVAPLSTTLADSTAELRIEETANAKLE